MYIYIYMRIDTHVYTYMYVRIYILLKGAIYSVIHSIREDYLFNLHSCQQISQRLRFKIIVKC